MLGGGLNTAEPKGNSIRKPRNPNIKNIVISPPKPGSARPGYVEEKLALLEFYKQKAACQKSPTGAHHRICTPVQVDVLYVHRHILQKCKYCEDEYITPCDLCKTVKPPKRVRISKPKEKSG